MSICAVFVRVLKTRESDFKDLKILKIGFWSLKVLDFFLTTSKNFHAFKVLKKMKASKKQMFR